MSETYEWVDKSVELAKKIANQPNFEENNNPFEEFQKREEEIFSCEHKPWYPQNKKWCIGENNPGDTAQNVIKLLDNSNKETQTIFKIVADCESDYTTIGEVKEILNRIKGNDEFKSSFKNLIELTIKYNNIRNPETNFNIQRLSVFLHHIRPDLFIPICGQITNDKITWYTIEGYLGIKFVDDANEYIDQCLKAISCNDYTDNSYFTKQQITSQKLKYRIAYLSSVTPKNESNSDPQEGKQNMSTETILTDIIKRLKLHHNIVLHGAPGTGKTFLAKKIAKLMNATEEQIEAPKDGTKEEKERINEILDDYYKLVQFHPSYDYTDFVEGLRSYESKDGTIGFRREDGVFKEFCKKAIKDKEHNYVFIIDEINRGNMSKIFGELFFSIDPGYRGIEGRVDTQYQNLIKDNDDVFKSGFYVPENVYIIGTMNDIDRSVECMDFAFRRRFVFKEIMANEDESNKWLKEEKLGDVEGTKAIKVMKALNNAIYSEKKDKDGKITTNGINGLNSGYHIGPAYFAKLKEFDVKTNPTQAYKDLWNLSLKPLLREYVRGNANPAKDLNDLEKEYKAAVKVYVEEVKVSDEQQSQTETPSANASTGPQFP